MTLLGELTDVNISSPVDGQQLGYNLATLKWINASTNYPEICLTGGGSVSVNNATYTTIPLTDADVYDPLDMHDPSSNSSRVTVPSAGLYVLIMSMNCNLPNTNSFLGRWRKNGSTVLASCNLKSCRYWGNISNNMFYAELVANDYIELQAYQNSGSAKTVNGYFSGLFRVK